MADEVEKYETLSSDAYKEIMVRIKQRTNESGKRLFMPVRAALTGKIQGLELEKIFVLLGREKILERAKSISYK